jgi:hypothetical protein
MMEADPRDLAGEGDPKLALHLETCEKCRSLSEKFLASQLGLARELDERAPRLSAEEALQVAKRRVATIRRRNARWQIGAPMAAAAGLAGLVLLVDDGDKTEALARGRVPEQLPGLEVVGPPGKDVVVFKVTDRPDVVVVWFFDSGDE